MPRISAELLTKVYDWDFQNRVFDFWIKTRNEYHPVISDLAIHKLSTFCTSYVWKGILKNDNHEVQKLILLEKCWECPLSSIVLYQSTYGWPVQKSSSASIPLVVFDNFYQLSYFCYFFSPQCFHYVIVLLLYRYFRGWCAFVWFRNMAKTKKCLLRMSLHICNGTFNTYH